MPKDLEKISPLLLLYHQISSSAHDGFNARDFLLFLHNTLNMHNASYLQQRTLQQVSIQAFHRFDRNNDGKITLEDIQSLEHSLRRILAPTSSNEISDIIQAASQKFEQIAQDSNEISISQLEMHFITRVPLLLPCKAFLSEILSSVLMEIIHPSPLDLRKRSITKERWIQTALRL